MKLQPNLTQRGAPGQGSALKAPSSARPLPLRRRMAVTAAAGHEQQPSSWRDGQPRRAAAAAVLAAGLFLVRAGAVCAAFAPIAACPGCMGACDVVPDC
jgi:hypothetical protein